MFNETFWYFWRRTVPGGIWWENKEDTGVQFLWLLVVPMAVIGWMFGHFEDAASLQPLYEAYSQTSWYAAFPVSIVAFVLASLALNTVLFLSLKAIGFAIMIRHFHKFMDQAELEWLMALNDPLRPTDLDKTEWLFDRIDEMARAQWRLSMGIHPKRCR